MSATGISYRGHIKITQQKLKGLIDGGAVSASVTLQTSLWSDYMQALSESGLHTAGRDRTAKQHTAITIFHKGRRVTVTVIYVPQKQK